MTLFTILPDIRHLSFLLFFYFIGWHTESQTELKGAKEGVVILQKINLDVNGNVHQLEIDPEAPLLYVLRNDLGLKGPKYGCGSEQCGACKILIDGAAVPSCQFPVGRAEGLKIITVEGLGTTDALHPLQEAFIEEQAIQCGYCASGMIIAAQGLLNRTRYPTDDEIRSALDDNLCRCGLYDRVRRAIKLRIGRPLSESVYEVVDASRIKTDGETAKYPADIPGSVKQNPELDTWIRINDRDTITILTGKAEIGQGIKTAVTQIAAEELSVSLERIQVISADTGQTPDEGSTTGSMSLQMTGNAIQHAAAAARSILLAMAFEELEAGTAPESLVVEDGTIVDPTSGRQITYWELFGGQRFHHRLTRKGLTKPAASYQVVGKPVQRLDLLSKVTGSPSFVHDLELPGMLHGRVVRPPTYGARLISLDDQAVKQIPGVLKIVRDGSFLALIARREDQAVRAWEALGEAVVWRDAGEPLPSTGVYDHLLNHPAQSFAILDGTAVSGSIPPLDQPENGDQTLQATYRRPYQMHGSLGPSAAAAQLLDDKLTVWSHTQAVFQLQETIAQVLEMSSEDVRVIHTEGSGCYGHNGADDVALDAALLARAVPGKPVSVKWMRSDEHTWEPYGTAMVVKMQASLGSDRKIVSWNHDVWSYPHVARARAGGNNSGLLASWHLERPWNPPQPRFIMGTHFGSYRNADPIYRLPGKRMAAHFVPDSPLRTSSLRGLGAYANIFAIESFIDELSYIAGVDPVEFRLRYLADERARSVITAATKKAAWEPKCGPSGDGQGRGFAIAQYKNVQCYCAIIVDVAVDVINGHVDLQRAFIAADAGQIVNPDGLSSQLEGGFVQSASWTLFEQVLFDERGIQSRDWDSYPILRFSSAPEIKTLLLNRPGSSFLGSGEAAQGPTAAAIANAIFDAVGVRIRDLPITSKKILRALKER